MQTTNAHDKTIPSSLAWVLAALTALAICAMYAAVITTP